jgi:alpha-galactosidase
MTSTRRSARGATLTARLHQQELTVQAVVTGERELAVQALVLDPFVPDSAQRVPSSMMRLPPIRRALKRFAS